jgi:hypothetical protein
VSHYGFTGTKFWIDKRSKAFFVFLTNRTFPAKEGETDHAPRDSGIIRKICNTVLRSNAFRRNEGGLIVIVVDDGG